MDNFVSNVLQVAKIISCIICFWLGVLCIVGCFINLFDDRFTWRNTVKSVLLLVVGVLSVGLAYTLVFDVYKLLPKTWITLFCILLR